MGILNFKRIDLIVFSKKEVKRIFRFFGGSCFPAHHGAETAPNYLNFGSHKRPKSTKRETKNHVKSFTLGRVIYVQSVLRSVKFPFIGRILKLQVLVQIYSNISKSMSSN